VRYRPEIDGLRAVAVVPVVLYHAGIAAFSGGYVGVDVFFVISGYLITSILIPELEAGRLGIAAFYERRARRILPALFVVMAVVVAVAWMVLLPREMKILGQTVTASSAFLANVYFFAEGNDYFGLHADENPLLHLWSLAVEEQFYLVFPLFLLVAWRMGRRRTSWALVAASLASLAWSEYSARRSPTAAFFLLPSRAWELLLGALLALRAEKWVAVEHRRGLRDALTLVGLSSIVGSVFWFDAQTPFPGFSAVLPAAGTAMVIAFSPGTRVSARLLASRPLVGIGLVSFGIYLWHQPLFAIWRVWRDAEPNVPTLCALAALSVALAAVTWRFVERPFRDRRWLPRRKIFSLAVAGSTAFAAFGIVGHFNSGYPGRSDLFQRLAINTGLSLRCNGNTTLAPACTTGAQPQLAVLGNSFAMHLVDGIRSAYPDEPLVQLTQDSCEPRLGERLVRAGKLPCSEFFARALTTIRQTPSIQTVFVSSPFTDLLEGQNAAAFEQLLDILGTAGKRAIIVGPTPSNGTDIGRCLFLHRNDPDPHACDFARASVPAKHFAVVERLRQAAEKHGALLVDLTDPICDATICRASIGGTIIFRDAAHLSREGSRLVLAGIPRAGSGGPSARAVDPARFAPKR
jgi:peptidoglycan/LPS O-acetylase OafA/YrhL